MTSAVMPTYASADVAFIKGEGAYLFDEQGKRHLDFASGVAVTALGHGHPQLLAALAEQSEKVWHTSNLFRVPGQEVVAATLVANTFADQVFFTNSGAEAVECGLKMVRKYFDDVGQADRYRIISCTNGFHGRTLATIAAGGQEKHLAGFGPIVDGFDHVPFGNLNELRAAIGDETAAILVEPVQGEGGINYAQTDFLRAVRETCDEFGLLMFLDEVQTGVGRTGKLYAHEWAGVTPDIMASAKGLGGGFPVGACLATAQAACGMTAGTHGSTYGGNPLAMAATGAVLDVVLADGFLDGVNAISKTLWMALEKLAQAHAGVIEDVRGLGLMIGLRFADAYPCGDVVAALRAGGMLTVPAGDNVVRLLPPLIINKTHVEEAVSHLDAALHKMVETT